MAGRLLRRTGSGFSFPEILVAMSVIAVLSAIALPFTLKQQSRTVEVQIRSDLVKTASTIEAGLRSWRAKAPGVWLFICNAPTVAQYPAGWPRENTCAVNEWEARTASGSKTNPPLEGGLADTVVIRGAIAPDGSYCLDGTSTKAGVTGYRFAADEGVATAGSCSDYTWVPTGGIRGNTKPGFGSQPQPGIGAAPVPTSSPTSLLPVTPGPVSVCFIQNGSCVAGSTVNGIITGPVGASTIRISWPATGGTNYQVTVSGQPTRVTSLGATGTATCNYPANKCTGPYTGYLSKGTYKIEVRAKNGSGWSAPGVALFSIV